MLDRHACQRRVYRLATLLTGNPNKAAEVIRAVVDAQPELGRLDGAHMDRLTILRAREIKSGTIVDEKLPGAIAAAVGALPHQQREAWVLCRVYRLSPREAARAMDCSVVATNRHLEQAGTMIEKALADEAADAAQRLLEYSMALDVPEFYRAAQRRRSNLRRLAVAGAILVIVAAAAVAMHAWLSAAA